jgi:phage antirepressor YoqD-like protein
MNQLVKMSREMTMDSLEFLREIINPSRLKLGEPEVQNSKFVARVEDELDDLPAVKIIHRFGNEVRSYDLTIRQMMLVGMRESKAVRRAVMEKLESMSKPNAPEIPQTYAAALLEAGRLAMELERAEAQLSIAAPKADFVDRYVDATGTYGFRQVAKMLSVKESWFSDFLIDNSIMYRLSGKLTAHSCHIDSGRFVARAGVAQNDHSYTECRFTAKGVEWVAGEIAKRQVMKVIA